MRPIVIHGHLRPLTWVQFNRDGDLFFTCSKDHDVKAWFTETGKELGVYKGHNGALWYLDVNYSSTLLLTGGGDSKMKLWDVETGKEIFNWDEENPVKCVGFASGDKHCLALVDGKMGITAELKIYPLRTDPGSDKKEMLQPTRVFKNPHAGKPSLARWTNQNKSIISSGEDGKLILWDVETGQMSREIKAHDAPIRSWQFNHNKTFLLTASSDKTAKLYDTRNFELIKTYQTDRPLNACCMSPNRFHVLLGGGQEAGSVTTTSSRSGKFEALFYHTIHEELIGSVRGHFGPINALAFSPNGNTYVSGGEDGTLRVHHLDKSYTSLPN